MGDLEIRSGTVVAVDAESLRAAAAGFDRLALDAMEVRLRVAEAGFALAGAPGVSAQRVIGEVEAVTGTATELAAGLREAATVYELVELEAQRAAALAAGDAASVRSLQARYDALAEAAPDAAMAARLLPLLTADPHDALLADAVRLGLVGAMGPAIGILGLGVAAAVAIRAMDRGTLPPGSRLAPYPAAVQVERIGQGRTVAPTSVAALAGRIPTGGATRVRVERYTMPSGDRRFAVYIAGTAGSGGAETFDAESNLDLYAGRNGEAYAATRAALRDAGAEPGDSVLVTGHSQGAMAGTHLALAGEYDVGLVTTFGSPVQGALGEGTLHLDVQHGDDPVSALSGAGHPTALGGPGSLVVDRTAEPGAGVSFDAHHLSVYAETARMIDASADPRLDAVRSGLAELEGAASAVVFVYSAKDLADGGAAAAR